VEANSYKIWATSVIFKKSDKKHNLIGESSPNVGFNSLQKKSRFFHDIGT
jgi:hypothetical protein